MVPNKWQYLEKFGEYGLARRSMPLRVTFERLIDLTHIQFTLLHTCGKDVVVQLPVPVACLLHVVMLTPHDGRTEGQSKSLSVVLTTATEK